MRLGVRLSHAGRTPRSVKKLPNKWQFLKFGHAPKPHRGYRHYARPHLAARCRNNSARAVHFSAKALSRKLRCAGAKAWFCLRHYFYLSRPFLFELTKINGRLFRKTQRSPQCGSAFGFSRRWVWQQFSPHRLTFPLKPKGWQIRARGAKAWFCLRHYFYLSRPFLFELTRINGRLFIASPEAIK